MVARAGANKHKREKKRDKTAIVHPPPAANEEKLPFEEAVVLNMKPAKIFGQWSYGMLLAAEIDGKLALLTTDHEIPNGARIT